MSADRLHLEQDLRRAEQAREVEELRKAQDIRREREAARPPPPRFTPALTSRTPLADYVEKWRRAMQGMPLRPSQAQIRALIRRLREMERAL